MVEFVRISKDGVLLEIKEVSDTCKVIPQSCQKHHE
jgi:hypothetical protein